MPELPDVEVFTRNLDKIFAGSTLKNVKIVYAGRLADKPADFRKALYNKKLKRIFRSGKEMRFEFEGGRLLGLHLMLTGDVFVGEKRDHFPFVIASLQFSNGLFLFLTDRMKNAHIRIDPVDKKGVDALSPSLTFSYLKNALQRKSGIKKLLTNQDIIRGIGNGYSDEILWDARISPYSISSALPDPQIRKLLASLRKILKRETEKIYRRFPGKVNVEVKDFMKIHRVKALKSPTGFDIQVDKKGMMKTYYTSEQALYT